MTKNNQKPRNHMHMKKRKCGIKNQKNIKRGLKMKEPLLCSQCNLGKKVSIVGDGITEPPYLQMIRCPFDNEYYKYPDDECNQIDET